MNENLVWNAVPNGTENGMLRLSVVAAPMEKTISSTDDLWPQWTKHIFAAQAAHHCKLTFTVEISSNSNPPPVAVECRYKLPDGFTVEEVIALWPVLFPPQYRGTGKAVREFAEASHSFDACSSAPNSIQQQSIDRLVFSYTRSLSNLAASLGSKYEDAINNLPRRRELPSELKWTIWPGEVRAAADNHTSQELKDWIATRLKDPNKRAEARRVERNLYRLSSNPWNDLTQDALLVAWYSALDQTPRAEDNPFPRGLPANALMARIHALQSTPKFEALRLAIFHGRVRNEPNRSPAAVGLLTADEKAQPPDFRQKIAMLNNYPHLMRALGLIFDLEIPEKDVPEDAHGVRVIVHRSQSVFGYSSTTRIPCRANFYPQSPTFKGKKLFENGALNPACYEVKSLETDSLMLDVIGKANSPESGRQWDIVGPETQGVSFQFIDRNELVQEQRQKTKALQAAALNAKSAPGQSAGILEADRLVRGFVLFVAREGSDGTYRSQCFRKETFKIGNKTMIFDRKHGCVAASFTTTHDQTSATAAGDSKDIHVHDTILTWNGWSLVVPNPLKSLDSDMLPETAPNDRGGKWGPVLDASFEVVPGSLARLRFGPGYRFILATMDIAGNVRIPKPDAPNFKPFSYLRFEPVKPPQLLLAHPMHPQQSPGEQLTHLVFRSDETRRALRFIVPPRASFRLAEQFGQFDARSPFDTGTFDAVQLKDIGGNFHVIETSEGEGHPEAQNPIYVTPRNSMPDCTYLPDPFVQGFSIRVKDCANESWVEFPRDPRKPNASSCFLTRSFYTHHQWPRAGIWLLAVEPQKLSENVSVSVKKRFVSGNVSAWFDAVVIRIPKGCEAEIHLRADIGPKDFNKLGVLSLAAGLPGFAAIVARLDIASQPNPTVIPERVIKMAHAVKKPVSPAEITSIAQRARERDETFQAFDMDFEFHRPSTGQVALLSTWQEWVDEGEGSGRPALVTKSAPVCEVLAAASEPSAAAAVATVNGAHVCTEKPLPRKNNSWAARLHGTYAPSGGNPQIRQDFGDTRHRRVVYSLVANTRYADYFLPRPIEGISSKLFPVSVPCTVPPPAPVIDHSGPLCLWTNTQSEALPAKVLHTRMGGGCRIWIKRPWYITGDQEKLGIVLWKDDHADQGSSSDASLVTRWGADPIWDGDVATRGPRAEHLLSDMRCKDLDISPTARVVLFTPTFDENEDMYYVDLRVSNVPSYFSFIRFALVRYQENAITGCRCSPITMTQFNQLTPDRTVSVMRHSESGQESKSTLNVVLSGAIANSKNFYTVQAQQLWKKRSSDNWWFNLTDEVPSSNHRAAGGELGRWRLIFDDVCAPKRIMVREYEKFDEDAEFNCDGTFKTRPTHRLVFADVLEI